jgi:hypothetical protein
VIVSLLADMSIVRESCLSSRQRGLMDGFTRCENSKRNLEESEMRIRCRCFWKEKAAERSKRNVVMMLFAFIVLWSCYNILSYLFMCFRS